MIQQGISRNGTGYSTSALETDGEVFTKPEAIHSVEKNGGRHIPDQATLATQRHNVGASNTSVARMSREAAKKIAMDIATRLFDQPAGDETLAMINQKKHQLCLQELVSFAKGSAGNLNEFQGETSPRAIAAKVLDFKQACSASGTERTRLFQAASGFCSKILEEIHGIFERMLSTAPKHVNNIAPDFLNQIATGKTDTRRRTDLLREFESLGPRFEEISQVAKELPTKLREKISARYSARAKDLANQIAEAILAEISAEALAREGKKMEGKLKALETRATIVIGNRALAMNLLGPKGVADRPSAGREITLSIPDENELLGRALLTRSAVDKPELAQAYRAELSDCFRFQTEDDARRFAARLLKLVGDDCSTHSIYDLIQGVEQATNLVGQMHKLAHPHVELRMTSEELGVLLSINEQFELPEADTPSRTAIREAMIAEIRRLAGDTCKIVDRPSDIPVIRLCRMVAGYPSVCDSNEDFLQNAHQTLGRISQHDPYEFDSEARPAEASAS